MKGRDVISQAAEGTDLQDFLSHCKDFNSTSNDRLSLSTLREK